MNVAAAAGIVLIVIWAVATFVLGAPGWIHLLLTLGVFVLIWGIVMRGTRTAAAGAARARRTSRVDRAAK